MAAKKKKKTPAKKKQKKNTGPTIPIEDWVKVEQKFNAYPVEVIGAKVIIERLENLLDEVENGKGKWECPWSKGSANAPRNWSGYLFNGGNVLMTIMAGYESPFWFTFNQIEQLGGQIREGERSTIIVGRPKMKVEIDDETGEEKRIWYRPRYFREWNAEQVDWPEDVAEKIKAKSPEIKTYENSPIEQAEKALNGMPNPPVIKLGGDRACYRPATDDVHLPEMERFREAAEFYSTKAHELVHSTGNKKRLNRPSINEAAVFSSKTYSYEELVAELGAFILLTSMGCDNPTTRWNSAAYVRGWLERLTNHPEVLAAALKDAQKAVEYVLDIKYKPADKPAKKKAAKKKTSKKAAKKPAKKIGKKDRQPKKKTSKKTAKKRSKKAAA
jgi:antirestriction protein ArdC